MAKQKVLLVGAGAVGQAYGFHLSRSGAEVTFYVKPKYADTLSQGLRVRCLNGTHRGLHDFTAYSTISTLADVQAHPWDQVWLCVSSPALHSGWVPDFVSAIGDAPVITLQPGIHDYEYLSQYVEDTRLVRGMITLASYQGPLSREPGPAAMTWWFPPLSKAPFSGPFELCTSVVESLKRGGFPARAVTDVSDQLRFGSALFMPIIAALEKNSWSFKDLARSGDLALAGQAGREASELVLPGRNRWRAALMTHPWVLRLVLMVAPRVAPFNLEEMLRHHFTKVGAQTRAMLSAYIALAEHRETSSQSLEKLLMALSTP